MRENKAVFTKNELAVNLGDSSVQFLGDNWFCEGVRSDSREIKKGNLFVALKGENTDGHKYINDALELGASAVLVDKSWYKENQETTCNRPLIVVSNTLKALGKLANIHRRRFNIPIVAIAGSNGKTTTKDMTASVLSQKFKVLSTYRNFNNQIGLPFMLFQLDDSFEMAVLEIGTNESGEIATLSNILEPTHGLITNIGKEHLEKLIDLDGVEMEETFLFGFLHKTGGVCFINLDDNRLSKYKILLEDEVTYACASKEAMIQADISINETLQPKLKLTAIHRKFEVELQTTGYASGLNALAAASVGFHFGLTDEEIKNGLESFRQESGHGYARMVVEHFGKYKILNDCYNANPDSTLMALKTLSEIHTKGRKYAVLGDMKELGEASLSEHTSILNHALKIADFILVVGKDMRKAAEEFPEIKNLIVFENKDEIADYLFSYMTENDVALVKGSRGMAMENIINELKSKIMI